VTIVSIIDKIKQARDSEADAYEIPEWGVTVEVRSMSARQRAGMNSVIETDATAAERQELMWGYLLCACVFDPETGDPVFTEDDMDWVLTDKSFAVIDRLTAKCLEVSSVNREAVDEAGKSSSGSQTAEE
jgi:hypothetical protein